jgi:lipoprotein-anchoring transpeptidase ErfK/SrfK
MFRRVAYALVALAVAGALSGAQASIVITINKSAQRMTVEVDGEQRWVWPVSTGRSGYSTPSGSFTAFRMEEDHYSKEWDDAPMPHSIFFTKKGHAIHGTFDQKRLGTAASHGCVRLSTAHAATLFALVKRRGVTTTKVVLLGHEPAAAPAMVRRQNQRERVEAELDPALPPPVVTYRGQYGFTPEGQFYRRDGQQPAYIQPGYGRQEYPVYRQEQFPPWGRRYDW